MQEVTNDSIKTNYPKGIAMAPYSRFYKSVIFKLPELVDPETYKTFGESSWRFLDPLLLATLDRIRGRYGKPMIINNWNVGGPYMYRGFRPPSCKEGAQLSSHRRGTAADFDVVGMTDAEILADIKANPQHMDFSFITVVEETLNGKPIGWTHISVENMDGRIKFINA